MSLSAWALIAFPSIYVAVPVVFMLSTGNMSSELGLTAYFQSAAKEDEVGSVTGFIYSLATAASMAAILAMGWAFDAFSASAGFMILAAAMTAASALYYLSSRTLARGKRGSKRTPDPPAAEPGTAYEAFAHASGSS
ncbi:MAG: hypothetical protein ABII00_17590 [Elusimicrobiota bacterium]